MLVHEHDEKVDAHYISERDEHGFVDLTWRTVSLGKREVNLDYDERGNVIGVEIL